MPLTWRLPQLEQYKQYDTGRLKAWFYTDDKIAITAYCYDVNNKIKVLEIVDGHGKDEAPAPMRKGSRTRIM